MRARVADHYLATTFHTASPRTPVNNGEKKARSMPDSEHKALPSLLPSLLGLLFERSFAATAVRPPYVEDAASYSTF
jgi:hypothetical protein